MKLVIGKKLNSALAISFGVFAVIDFISGNFPTGLLELIIALHSLSDVLEGKETTVVEISRKGRV